MQDTPRTFHLTWLTSTPLLRGSRMAIMLSLIPAGLACLALVATSGGRSPNQALGLFSAAIFLSVGATLIQYPAYLGRIELTDEALIVVDRLSGKRGRLHIPREQLQQAYFDPLTRPPSWLPYVWAAVELAFAVRSAWAGWGSGSGHWYWLTAFVLGLCFWPLMVARWKADMQVVLVFGRKDDRRGGLIRAWATPHQADSLVNTIHGKIDWEVPPERSSLDDDA